MRILYALALGATLAAPVAVAGNKPGGHASPSAGINPNALVVAGRIIVKLQPGQDVGLLDKVAGTLQAGTPQRLYPRHRALGAEERSRGWVDLSNIYELTFSAPYRTEAALALVRGIRGIAYAEPRYMHKTCYLTNDPKRPQQPHLLRVQAAQAWDIHKGDSNTVVGIVDSGVDWDHPDIVGNVAYNRADPIDGIDNDNDGYVDNFRGWDLAGADYNNVTTGDNNPMMTAANNQHGSHVAGIAGATTDNAVGIAGTGFKCRILPVKCAADNDTRAAGSGYILTGYEGIQYAADHGVSVINCSWGGAGLSSYENDIINYATFNKNVLVVAAAGNDNVDTDFFPACFDNVLSVAATGSANDNKAGFSNFNTRVSVSAPGANVYATVFNDSYTLMSGTSMASPLVAGACALIRSYLPTLTPAQVVQQVRVTADDIYNLPANSAPELLGKLGKGRLNMFRALTERTPGIVLRQQTIDDGNDQYFEAGDTLRIRASFINRLFPSSTALTATFSSASTAVTVDANSSVISLGALGTNDSTQLSPDVLVIVNPGAPDDATVNIRIDFEDGAYNDFATLELQLNSTFVNFSRNIIASTVASEGRIGYASDQQTKGLGVQLLGWGNMLYGAGQISGKNNGVLQLASSVYGDQGAAAHDDFTSINNVKPSVGTVADHEFMGVYANGGLGTTYTHHTYIWDSGADTGFYIHEYVLQNTAATAQQNLYSGIFADCDVSPSGRADNCRWDSTRHMGYIYSTDSALSFAGGPYIGIVLLSPDTAAGKNFFPVNNDGTNGSPFSLYDGFSTAEQYQSISSGIARTSMPANGRGDVSMSLAYGPLTLAPGRSRRLGYAICVGHTLQELQTAADQATTRYTAIITANKSLSPLTGIELYPNPAQDIVQVSHAAGSLISVTDLRGATQNVGRQGNGNTSVLDVSALPPGIYMVAITNVQGRAVRRLVKQ